MHNERFRPRIPANENATQRIPGLMPSASVESNEKLKITSTSKPNQNMELMDSLFRNSMAMSLWTIANIGLTEFLPSGSVWSTLRGLPDHETHWTLRPFLDP